jgi:hypothetical protein
VQPVAVCPAFQIHHAGGGIDHWLVSALVINDDGIPTVVIIDTANRRVTPSVQAQLRRLYSDKAAVGAASKLTVSVLGSQQQKGPYDCGLFAIAYTYIIASSSLTGSELIEEIESATFDQGRLRQHLLQCLQDKAASRRSGLRRPWLKPLAFSLTPWLFKPPSRYYLQVSDLFLCLLT